MTPTTDSKEHAELVAQRCAAIAKSIAKKGQRVRFISNALRLSAACVGLAALVVTYVPEIKAISGAFGPYISLLAALVLVFGSVSSIVMSTSPPERYADFARYIDYYDHRLKDILSDETLSNPVRMARLKEITTLATVNLNDVKATWPWVE